MLAHGSRHPLGVDSIERLARAVAEQTGAEAYPAYLDLNEPDITAVARELLAAGHRNATVVPLLFTPAFHARSDAPAAIDAARRATGLGLRVGGILGTPDELIAPLLQAAADAGIPDRGDLLLAAVGSSRPEANATIEDLARRIAAVRGAPVRAAFATCEPRATDLVREPGCAGVLSLFVGHGLLLDKVRGAAAEHGVPVTAPLEERLAELVIQRAR